MEKTEVVARRVAAMPYTVTAALVAIAVYYAGVAFSKSGAESTRISEHALMPGIVLPSFDREGQQRRWLTELEKQNDLEARSQFILEKMSELSIESTVHSWRKTTILKNSSGVIAVARMRAYRSTGAEAMIVAARLEDARTVALIMAIALHSRDHSYWSRDILFVFVSGGAVGMDAWLEEYYGMSGGAREHAEKIQSRGRFIVGAIVVETSEDSEDSSVDLRVGGINGQLPNLDLFNTVVRIASRAKTQMPVSVYSKDESSSRRGEDGLVPVRFLLSQAFTGVEGVHSVFSKYGVQALTICAPQRRSGLGKIQYLIESVMRSLNNLHERFHQSYFLYVLITPGSFSSIAFYLPIVGLLIAPILIFGFGEWLLLEDSRFQPNFSLIGLLIFGLATLFVIDPLVEWIGIDEDGATRVVIASLLAPTGLASTRNPKCSNSTRFVILLSLSLALCCLSLVNYALSLAAAVCVLPAVLIAMAPATTRLGRVTRTLLILLFNPLCLMLLGRLATISLHYDWWSRADARLIEWAVLQGGPQFLLTSIYEMIDQYYTLGSWQLPLLLIFAGPAWNALLVLSITVDKPKA